MTKVKFAVVREDPLIEELIIRKFNCKNILLIASGGCVALSLKSMFADVNFTLFDLSYDQINLVKNKIKALEQFEEPLFNIGIDKKNGLNACGEFEGLFRSFRSFLYEFVLGKSQIEHIFLDDKETAKNIIAEMIGNKYWPIAFELFFSDSILITMFGQDAVQHAEPNSYPDYFRRALEKGLKRPDFKVNYFLQSIFLGYYLKSKSSWPYYLINQKVKDDFRYINDSLLNIPVKDYDLISLSNIFDWMSKDKVINHLNYLNDGIKKGGTIIFRQLNNDKNYVKNISGLKYNENESKNLLRQDRSLFYNHINILTKV